MYKRVYVISEGSFVCLVHNIWGLTNLWNKVVDRHKHSSSIPKLTSKLPVDISVPI